MTSTPMTPPPGQQPDTDQGLSTETVKEQAGEVLTDARDQARQLAGRAGDELSAQATSQQQRAAKGLHAVSGELRSMADQGQESGVGAQLARQGSELTRQLADFLDTREPGQLLDEARSFARRHPGGFLLGAVAAGVLAGRLTRALASDADSAADSDARPTPDPRSPGLDPLPGAADAGLVPPPPPPGRTEAW